MSPIRCLIVDPDRDAAERLKDLLTKIENVEVIGHITTSARAIMTIQKTNPDLVFIEIEMPRKNGFDVMKELRNNQPKPKFIIITAYDHYAIKALNSDVFGYLLKPVDIDEIKKLTSKFLDHYIEVINSQLK